LKKLARSKRIKQKIINFGELFMFQGAFTAIITPFKNGTVDYETFERLIEFQIENGIDGLVPVGTTGESPTLNHQEHKDVIKFVVDRVAGRVPVIAGTGSNSTSEAVDLTDFARKAGVTASLQVCPYYNKPTQEGFYQHFKAINDSVDLPMVLYNIPGRCGGEGLAPETIARLNELEQVVAVKEATGSMDQASEILSLCDITILSGDDSMTLPLCSLGGKGVVSVVANIVPADVKSLTDSLLAGDFAAGLEMHRKLFRLSKSLLKMATNPIPIKAAMELMSLSSDEMRLPMVSLSSEKKSELKGYLHDYGLI
jgi:4-hydroxy-tetrahydrodipicolinate synthase